ncbi:MAG: leucine-rich repeat domain-containing protein, partial [Bacteroidota bacterium]
MSAAAPRIDVGDLDFLLDRVVCTAHSGNGGLSLVLAIRAADPDAAHEAGLTSEYNRGASGGVLTFQFEGRGVYGPAGVPAGQFSIAKGRAQRRHARFHVQGTDYSLDFEGTVGFAEEHAIIRGQFRRFYGLAAPSFDVDIDMPVDVDAIDWTGYVFSTLGEIALAPPDAVRRVVLSSPEFTCLPAEVTRLHALTALTIENPEAYRTTLRLRDLTPEIGQLRALKRLAVNGAALDSLPAEIGQLEALEHLSISLCTGVEIPAEVWRLPRLTHLFLSRNQLTSVPNDIHLPALKSLDLSDNALRAIPAQVARLPSLHRLVIHGNPLESLTGELRDLPKLGLSIEERQRLLPMPYPGAEQGYPEAAYRIAAWPERVVRLDAVLEQAGPDIDP